MKTFNVYEKDLSDESVMLTAEFNCRDVAEDFVERMMTQYVEERAYKIVEESQ